MMILTPYFHFNIISYNNEEVIGYVWFILRRL